MDIPILHVSNRHLLLIKIVGFRIGIDATIAMNLPPETGVLLHPSGCLVGL